MISWFVSKPTSSSFQDTLFLPLVDTDINSEVWATQGKIEPQPPHWIHFKDPTSFVNQRHYHLKPEVRKRLEAITDNLRIQVLLTPCSSPWNTLILGVQNPNGEWRPVQDLHVINKVVVTIHLVVFNPYTLLIRIPEGTKCFTILDLNDAHCALTPSICLCSGIPPTRPIS